jgi:hypothetical protein
LVTQVGCWWWCWVVLIGFVFVTLRYWFWCYWGFVDGWGFWV